MKLAALLSAIALATVVAACADDATSLTGNAPPAGSRPAAANDDGSPAPAAQPGTTAAPGFQYFEEEAYTALGSCASCHSTGSNGAPILFGADVKSTYAALDGNGLILTGSPLLTKGPHAAGLAPALAPTSEAIVRKWLELEATDRVGKASPELVYAAVSKCMSPELFAKIDLCTAKTQPRVGENGNTCTGCKYEACSNCHAQGGQDTGFWCSSKSVGGKLVTDVTDTLTATAQLPFIRRYVGFAGATPIASNGIVNKSMTTASADSPSVHPWFVLDAARQKALKDFVDDALRRYAAGECGQ